MSETLIDGISRPTPSGLTGLNLSGGQPGDGRIIPALAFLALWTPDSIAASIAADPRLLAGCFKALAQGTVNLDSSETAGLLQLAVSKGTITSQDAARILAGTPPT